MHFFQSQDGAFYRAVLCVHHGEIDQAQRLIDLTREMLDTEVTALSLESYQRAYPTMVCVQVWPQTQSFSVCFLEKIIYLLGRQINDPSSGRTFFSFIPSSNFLFWVLDL